MPNIHVSDLHAVGSDLFDDSETFLFSLSEEDIPIQGGATLTVSAASAISVAISVGTGAAFIGSAVFGYQVAKDEGWK